MTYVTSTPDPNPMASDATREVGWYVLTTVRTDAWPFARAEPIGGPYASKDEVSHAIVEDKLRYWDGKRWRVN